MNILDEICAAKRIEVAAGKRANSVDDLKKLANEQSAPRGFERSLRRKQEGGFALVAEIKKGSPSKGLIRKDFSPAAHAAAYEASGAACLSVLTDTQFFFGNADDLRRARSACNLPVLRKDFIVDPWQVYEARALGADAILIILAAVNDDTAACIEAAALDCGMDALIEVHDSTEMERARKLKSRLIGINNRDLRSFTTDLSVSKRLSSAAPPDALLVAESGIYTHQDCEHLAQTGIRCFLVGESLMRQDDLQLAAQKLLGG